MESGGATARWLATLRRIDDGDAIRHVEHLPGRVARHAPWPDWTPPELVAAFGGRGIALPWAHQAEAAEIAHSGTNVVICTGTASGKSLAYQLPILAALAADPSACALYLSPTKALAADQYESLRSIALPWVRPAPYDGDTPLGDREWARGHGRLILTNPDMLHMGILPAHARWSRIFRHLAFVVVDECHSYRGVFGSHVALILRRLRRIAAAYGSAPTFMLASATVAEPAATAVRLIGAEVAAVTSDAAPHPGADFVLWEPPLLPDPDAEPVAADGDVRGAELGGPAVRRSTSAEAARIMAALVDKGARTLTFVRSRAGAEQVALTARRILQYTNPAVAGRISAYRGGYLPEDRRALEQSFDAGELAGVASTNALELGVDIAGIDATVLAGYPGTLASLWQQAGRAGRGDLPALVVFIARADPLDSYLVHHPEAVFARPVETAVTNPENPFVLSPHLVCAAAEIPLVDDDLTAFGGDVARSAVEGLVASKVLRRRPRGYYFAGHHHPAGGIALRGSGRQIALVEAETGRLLGTEDALRAPATVHPGAVYLHQGRSYVVRDLDLDGGIASLDADRPDWSTVARSISTVAILETHAAQHLPRGVRLATGAVRATEQVVGYLRRRADGTLIDFVGLDMPEHDLTTRAVWYTLPVETLTAAGVSEAAVPGALHAAEHAAIGLLPLFAGCDRWDIGGLSTAAHADTGEPTVIVYDGYAGGAGFAEHGFAVAGTWLSAVRDAVASCPCAAGCPSCVQSPKCGNGNHPLDKAGALVVLDVVTAALADAAR